MKKSAMVLLLICLILTAGCARGGSDVLELPGEPEVFEMGSYPNPDKAGDMYDAVRRGDKVYVSFGTVNNEQMDVKVIECCLGYIAGGDRTDQKQRVFSLAEDKKEIYLMVYDIDQDISQALFFRRADTRGRKLETPGYIDAVDYDFWD